MYRILDENNKMAPKWDNEFYQWDLDRKLIVLDASVEEVHFTKHTMENALVKKVYKDEETGYRLVDVPNILFQTYKSILVYGYDNDSKSTTECSVFKVNKKKKPDDYVYTETEVFKYSELEERIKNLEEKEEVATHLPIIGDDGYWYIWNPDTKEYECTWKPSCGDNANGAVVSVNGKIGKVVLNAKDVGALPDTTQIPNVPTNISAFINDIGYLTEHQQIKTINGQNLIGTGNIEIKASGQDDSLDIDYETYLAFDVTEIVIYNSTSTMPVLGQAILGQLVLV